MNSQVYHQIFMYGSNLNLELLLKRIPTWNSPFQLAFLPNHEVRFNKLSKNWIVAANIVPHQTRKVRGILVKFNDNELALMDKNEHYLYSYHDKRNHYKRKQVDVFLENDERVNASIYIAHPKRIAEGQLPSSDYLGYIIRGAKMCGLPSNYINAIEALGRGIV